MADQLLQSDKSVELLQDLLEEITDRRAELTIRDVDELVALYPEREVTIRRMAQAVCAMQTVSPQPRLDSDPLPEDGSPLPERLGDFRILREIARGGPIQYGVVD